MGFNSFSHTAHDGSLTPLFHSVHKTNHPTVITLLVDNKLLPIAEQKLLGIHDELLNTIPPSMHEHVIFADRKVQITGRIMDSASSRSYSSLFDNIIASNPQDDAREPPSKIPKIQLSYAQAAAVATPTQEVETVSELTDINLDTLLQRMTAKFGDFTPIKAEEFETKLQHQVNASMKTFDNKFEA